jgi:hypothetical protein
MPFFEWGYWKTCLRCLSFGFAVASSVTVVVNCLPEGCWTMRFDFGSYVVFGWWTLMFAGLYARYQARYFEDQAARIEEQTRQITEQIKALVDLFARLDRCQTVAEKEVLVADFKLSLDRIIPD